MKYVCLDYDCCGWYYYLEKEDYKYFLEQVIPCEECSNLAVLVSDDFDVALALEQNELYIILQEKK